MKPKPNLKIDKSAKYYLETRTGHPDKGSIWKIKGGRLWAWQVRMDRWEPKPPHFIKDVKEGVEPISAAKALSLMSQIRFPLHVVNDAQGPCMIMDAQNRAVMSFTETHSPTNGYCWQAEAEASRELYTEGQDTTYYSVRNDLIRKVLGFIEGSL